MAKSFDNINRLVVGELDISQDQKKSYKITMTGDALKFLNRSNSSETLVLNKDGSFTLPTAVSSSPDSPASGGVVFTKSDGKLYFKNSSGTEYNLVDTGEDGDITGVTAGVGLSGGGTTGDVSLALDVSELTALGTTAASGDYVVIQDVTDNSTKKVLVSNLPSSGGGATLSNGVDNRVVTAAGASSLNGEANLTFDGNTLTLTKGSNTASSIVVDGANEDIDIIRVKQNGASSYAYSIKYLGAGTGDFNRFALVMDNLAGTDVNAILADQDGDITFGADVDVSTHDGSSNGFKLGGTLVTSTAAELNYLDGANSNITSLTLPASTTISSFGKTLIDDTNAAAARTTLGLGSLATLSSIDISSNTNLAVSTGLDLSGDTLSVDVSDFMASGASNRVLTSTGTDAFKGNDDLTWDGASLTITKRTETTPAIIVDGGSDTDADIIRVLQDGAQTHGWAIRYLGDNNGDFNQFALVMDNQSDTDINALLVDQDGDATFGADVNISTHDGSANGFKLGGTLVTSTAAELNYLDGADADIATLSLPANTTISSVSKSLLGYLNTASWRSGLGLGSLATLNSIDISSNTNLSAGTGITLTGDSLSLSLSDVISSDGSNRVLTSDGDGTLTAESNIHINGGLLGIGTSSPNAGLHIDVSGEPQLLLDGGGNSTGDIVIPDTEILQIGHWNEGTTTYTDRLRIKSDGVVAVAGTLEAAALDISGDVGVGGHITLPQEKELRFDSSDTRIYANADNPEDLYIEADEDLYLSPDDSIFISSASSTWSKFDGTNQRLGVNTLFPSKTLDVNGDMAVDDITAVSCSFTGDLTVGTNALFVDNTTTEVAIGRNTSGYGQLEVYKNSSTAPANITIHQDHSSGDSQLHLRSDGNDWYFRNDGGDNDLHFKNENDDLFKMTDGGNFYALDGLISGSGDLRTGGTFMASNQPGFLARLSSDQSDIAEGTQVTVAFNSENYDTGADFNTSTHKFVAPKTGRYFFSTHIGIKTITQNQYFTVDLNVGSTPTQYRLGIFDPNELNGTVEVWSLGNSIVVYVTQGEEVYVTVEQQTDGSPTTDLRGGSVSQAYSWFNGYFLG